MKRGKPRFLKEAQGRLPGGRTLGFTLTELLVSVAILVLLIALLLPTLSRMRSNFANTASISNLRTLGTGLLQYAGDNQGVLPARTIAIPLEGGGFASGDPWHFQLFQGGYVESRDRFMNPKENYSTWAKWMNDPAVNPSLKNFAKAWVPVYGYRIAPGVDDRNPLNVNRLQAPSKYFIVAESWFKGAGYPGYFVAADPAWCIKLDQKQRTNLLFADGHVESQDAAYFERLRTANDAEKAETGGGRYYLHP